MKSGLLKFFLRVWIGGASVIMFVGGWLMLGHAAKPVSADANGGVDLSEGQSQLAPLPTLEPLPMIENGIDTGTAAQSFNQQPFVQQPLQQFARPMFRSRGS